MITFWLYYDYCLIALWLLFDFIMIFIWLNYDNFLIAFWLLVIITFIYLLYWTTKETWHFLLASNS